MKRPLLFCYLMLLACAVRADDLTGRVGVGGSLGVTVPTGARWVTDNNKDGISYGAWLRYGASKHVGLGLTYDLLDFEGRSRLEPVLITGYYQFAPDCSWNPNVHAGFGAAMTRNIERTGRETALGLGLGLGVDRFLTASKDWSLGAVADWFWADRAGSNSHYVHAIRAGVSLGYWFGGEAVASPAPAAAPARAAAPKAAEKVSIELAVQFESSKDEVDPRYDDQLRKVADFLKGNADSSAEIEGHSDNVGEAAYNRDLSQRRAAAVRQALIDRFQIDGSRLSAKGYGPDQPVADNGTAEGRARNRRVVATFTGAK